MRYTCVCIAALVTCANTPVAKSDTVHTLESGKYILTIEMKYGVTLDTRKMLIELTAKNENVSFTYPESVAPAKVTLDKNETESNVTFGNMAQKLSGRMRAKNEITGNVTGTRDQESVEGKFTIVPATKGAFDNSAKAKCLMPHERR